MTVAPISPIDPSLASEAVQLVAAPAPSAPDAFSRLLMQGLNQVDQKVVQAEAMTKAFVLDDSIPVHQVTFALEQARLSVELMVQVRSRLVEGYQELMRMQL